MQGVTAEALALVVLVGVLVFALIHPRGLPEVVAAGPGALILCLAGVLSWTDAWRSVVEMLPTVVFLAGILMLSHLCQREGLFTAAGALMASRSGGDPVRLLVLVVAVASATTAVLSLDATVVLLTPVVLATASRLGVRPAPHAYATVHLANSASLLLPVSNLTNLLAMKASGLSFATFAALMAGPWLVAVAVELVVLRRYFAPALAGSARPVGGQEQTRTPLLALVVLGLTLAAFVVSSPLGVEPFWAALAGVAVLTAARMTGTARSHVRTELAELAKAANIWFLLFVLGLSIVVQAVVGHGAVDMAQALLPTRHGLVSLLVVAVVAALAANLVNNLPAVLLLTPLVAPSGPTAVLAVLIGVNVGPNLTYVGSLATLLWRRITADHDEHPDVLEFTRLGLLTVPMTLVLSTVALWAGSHLTGL